jgi:hypothetical protein
MSERAMNPEPGGARRASERSVAPSAATPASARPPVTAPAQALALQRAAGNRAVVRSLSRWAAHPDPDKKGVLMPDAMVAAYTRLNPPLNK